MSVELFLTIATPSWLQATLDTFISLTSLVAWFKAVYLLLPINAGIRFYSSAELWNKYHCKINCLNISTKMDENTFCIWWVEGITLFRICFFILYDVFNILIDFELKKLTIYICSNDINNSKTKIESNIPQSNRLSTNELVMYSCICID